MPRQLKSIRLSTIDPDKLATETTTLVFDQYAREATLLFGALSPVPHPYRDSHNVLRRTTLYQSVLCLAQYATTGTRPATQYEDLLSTIALCSRIVFGNLATTREDLLLRLDTYVDSDLGVALIGAHARELLQTASAYLTATQLAVLAEVAPDYITMLVRSSKLRGKRLVPDSVRKSGNPYMVAVPDARVYLATRTA